VGAVGIDLASVCRSITVVLTQFDYRVEDIHLSEQMRALTWDQELPDRPFDERVWAFMDAGNELRSSRCWGRNDALALLGLHRIAVTRERLTNDAKKPADRQAYILRSLKRPEEADLLRQVYGSRFMLIACYSPRVERKAHLETCIRESRVKPIPETPVHDADALMDRDEKESLPHGQDVRGTFHRADAFVDASDLGFRVKDGNNQKRSRFEIEMGRVFEIFFGHPQRTPSRDEFGMTQAAAAMRRSAELGRQVGAAICTEDGDVVAVGVNEVSKPGGGLYWEGDRHDAREFTLGRDTSDEHKRQIAEQVVEGLAKAELLGDGVDADSVLREIAKTDLDNLIEFIRAVHAEMAAIIDAARRGISVQGCTLYVTTFPCHHCARHVVAAGIKRVVYVAPYPKSMAEELHGDSLVVTSNAMLHGAAADEGNRRVRFEPFVGVSPARYMQMFLAPARKDPSGALVEWSAKVAEPRLSDLEPEELRMDVLPYLLRERTAQELLGEIHETCEPKLRVEPPPRSRRASGRKGRPGART
jgi:deoxycytidylate deaminase